MHMVSRLRPQQLKVQSSKVIVKVFILARVLTDHLLVTVVTWLPQAWKLGVLPKTPVQNPFANSLQSSGAPSINPTKSKPINHSYS